MSHSKARIEAAWILFLSALFTLPVIGLGVLKLSTGRDWGAGLQPSWALLALATLCILPEIFLFLRQTRHSWWPAIWPAAAALALSLAGLWIAPSGEAWQDTSWRYFKQVVQLGVMLFFVILPIFFLSRGQSLPVMAQVIVAGAAGQLVYSLAQGAHFYHPSATMAALEQIFTSNPAILAGSEQLYLNDTLHHIPRLRGTACEPLYLGNYLLFVLPLVGLTRWRRAVKMVLVCALGLLLLVTWSRGAWLAAMGAAAVLLVMGPRAGWHLFTPKKMRLMVGLVGLILLAGWWWRPESALLWQRLAQSFSSVDWSNLTRLYSMQAAWRGFVLSPVVGLGWGQFGYHFASLVDPMGLQSMFSWPVVNNFPLQIMCETGALGVAGLFWLARALGKNIQLRWCRAGNRERRTILLLTTSLIGVWLQLLTFSQFNLPHIWVGLGLLVGQLCRPTHGADQESVPE